jgi:hypothetical protein
LQAHDIPPCDTLIMGDSKTYCTICEAATVGGQALCIHAFINHVTQKHALTDFSHYSMRSSTVVVFINLGCFCSGPPMHTPLY